MVTPCHGLRKRATTHNRQFSNAQQTEDRRIPRYTASTTKRPPLSNNAVPATTPQNEKTWKFALRTNIVWPLRQKNSSFRCPRNL